MVGTALQHIVLVPIWTVNQAALISVLVSSPDHCCESSFVVVWEQDYWLVSGKYCFCALYELNSTCIVN